MQFTILIPLRNGTRCAFVNFKDRVSAERAAEAWAKGLDMDGQRVSVKWGRSKNGGASKTSASSPNTTPAVTETTA